MKCCLIIFMIIASYIVLLFFFIYVVIMLKLFITCFGHFNVCFHFIGDVRVEWSKNEPIRAKRSQRKQNWASHESMPRHGKHEAFQSKTQGWHAPFMPQHAKAVQKPDFPFMPQHAKSCRGMAMLIGQCYFWQVRFWDSYVILLSLLV